MRGVPKPFLFSVSVSILFITIYLWSWYIFLNIVPFVPQSSGVQRDRLDFVIYRFGIPVYWSEVGDLLLFHTFVISIIFIISFIFWRYWSHRS